MIELSIGISGLEAGASLSGAESFFAASTRFSLPLHECLYVFSKCPWGVLGSGVPLSWWSGIHCVRSIQWCVWSIRPSSPFRLPHLKCLFVLFLEMRLLLLQMHR